LARWSACCARVLSVAGLFLGGVGALPVHTDVRYRIDLGGEHAGFAHFLVNCSPSSCRARWESVLRASQESGGGTLSRRIDIEMVPTGEALWTRGTYSADGRTWTSEAGQGPTPASVSEVILANVRDGERRCIVVRDEESGRVGDACARRQGDWLEGEILGESIRFRAFPGWAPVEVVLPSQGAHFVADPQAQLPAQAPRLFGTVVSLVAGGRVCGIAPDASSVPAPAVVPREFPEGASCRERTARYLARVARAGLQGRHAIGVAFDGREFVWHEWAEVLVSGHWIAVDPSFEQVPAAGLRFTVARFEDGDMAGRAAAGRKVLACWSGAGRRPPARLVPLR